MCPWVLGLVNEIKNTLMYWIQFLDSHSRWTFEKLFLFPSLQVIWHFKNFLYIFFWMKENSYTCPESSEKIPCSRWESIPRPSEFLLGRSNHWGSKSNYNYIDYRGLYRTSVQDQDCKTYFRKRRTLIPESSEKNSELQVRIELTILWVYNLYDNDIYSLICWLFILEETHPQVYNQLHYDVKS